MIRFIFTLALLAAFLWFGATVSLGQRTLFGHVSNIWSSDEAQEMREDVKETTGPILDKAKKGAERGWKAMNADNADGGSAQAEPPSSDDAGVVGDAGTAGAPSATP